jgi:hypothetical protein
MIRIRRLRPAIGPALLLTLLSGCATKVPLTSAPVGPLAPVEAPASAPAPVLTPRMTAAAETLTRMDDLYQRMYRVAAPLLINNADLCKSNARNLLGFAAKNRYSYPGEYNEAAHQAFGMGERLQVTAVLAGSGAAQAGLKHGDGLVAAGGKPLPVGPNASTQLISVFAPLLAAQARLAMTIERGGAQRQLTIPVTRACGFGIELGNSGNINSYADGQRIMVTRGMLQFIQSDEEMAYVMAKGMAHNMLGHAAAQRNTSTLASVIDNLTAIKPDLSLLIGSGGIKAMPAEADVAADQLALYLVARAGYRLDAETAFWKRLAATFPATVLNGYVANHPATAARLTAIDKTIAEIKAKQAAKKPLEP